ncbi:disease resistance protein At4g27190 isoform X2 [Beta vulgaris subsp. vulgaris]|nr:disease resistance protein At4g27190 isoform X2 [Beta vulgaris subsp. vulgaris]
MDEGQKLVEGARGLLSQFGRWRCFLAGPKIRWDVCKLIYAMKVHDKKGDVLLQQALSDARGPCHGNHIPAKQLVGKVASKTLNRLKILLKGDKVGRIAIHGPRGCGKTLLMKHLHNYALDMFDNVFWVHFPSEFTIKSVQDVFAAVFNCDISRDDDLTIRSVKLSHTLASLGRFALFLDGVPEAGLSLEHLGIPVPAEGSGCKLVLSTGSNLVCRMLDGLLIVNIGRLPSEEAYQLFRHEARIDKGSRSSLDDMPRLLADSCCGVPQEIVHLATFMCGKDDPREWRYVLSQSGYLRTENKFPLIPEVEHESKRLKKDMNLSRAPVGKD